MHFLRLLRARAKGPRALLSASALFVWGLTSQAPAQDAPAPTRPSDEAELAQGAGSGDRGDGASSARERADRAPTGRALPDDAIARVLTLDQALSNARANSPSLKNASAQSDAAAARQDRARAVLLPQLVGTASYQRTTSNFVPRPGQIPNALNQASGSASWETYNFYNFGATATVPIYDFQGSLDRFRAARETGLAFAERVRAAELAAEFAVRNAFFQARAQRALIAVARDTLANNQRHLEQIQAFVEVGTRPEIDLTQVRTDLANARVALLQAANNYAIAKVTLQTAMGVEGELSFEVAEEHLAQLPDEAAALDVLLREALATRPDLIALQRDLRASELSERAAKGVFGPSLSASSALTSAGVELDNLRGNWNAGVALSWPLMRSGASFAELREAQANARAAAANMVELRQTVRLQLEQARLGVQAASAVLEAAGEALENARARLRLAEGRYQAGVGNIIELGDAQVALTSAEAQRISAEYSLSLARAQLLNALGRRR